MTGLGALFDRLFLRTSGELGRAGERRAELFYRLRGFRVVGRNVRVGRGELDLIVRRGKLLVFVEVKSRGSGSRGAAAESVDRDKQLQVARLAESWCRTNRIAGVEIRFDVVALQWNGWWFTLERFEAAFELKADVRRPWLFR